MIRTSRVYSVLVRDDLPELSSNLVTALTTLDVNKFSHNFICMKSKPGDCSVVRQDMAHLFPQPEYENGSAGPVLVRLAWHSSGTYDAATDTDGINGAGMRYEREGGDPVNAGLQHARVVLEPVKESHSWFTYSDL